MDNHSSNTSPENLSNPSLVAFRMDGIGRRLTDEDRQVRRSVTRVSPEMIQLSADIAEAFGLGDRFDVQAARRLKTLEAQLMPSIRELRVLLAQHESTLTRARLQVASQVWGFYDLVKAMLVVRPDDDRLAMMVDELRRRVADTAGRRTPSVDPGEEGGPTP